MTTNRTSDCVAIVSGGMDSVTLLHYLVKTQGRTPALITFNYGQKHAKEIVCAKYHATALALPDFRVVPLDFLQAIAAGSALVNSDIAVPHVLDVLGDPQPPTYVPNRNMLFLAIAVAYAEHLGVSDVYYGAQKHDIYGYWDTTPQFLAALNTVYALNRKSAIQIHAPLVAYTKTGVLELGLSLGVDYAQTWTCYRGTQRACGTCPTCAERLKAFADLGRHDVLPYDVPQSE